MTSALYGKFKEALISYTNVSLGAGLNLASDTVQASLCRTSSYNGSTNIGTDQFKSSATTVQTGDSALTSKTTVLGLFDAADVVFSAVTAGAAIDSIVVWKDTGTGSTSPLICWFDGFSVTPNGGAITAQWDNGTNRIFKL